MWMSDKTPLLHKADSTVASPALIAVAIALFLTFLLAVVVQHHEMVIEAIGNYWLEPVTVSP
ncbi:MAG: hypothetical protein J0G33_04210 [Afipia felis]|nr:hypothetical protein [Afipia felis]